MAAWDFYHKHFENQMGGTANANHVVDFDTDTINVAILTTAHTLLTTDAGDETWADVVAEEVSGTNYTANGITLTLTVTAPAAGVVTIDAAANPSWVQNGAGFANGQFFIFYARNGAADSDRPLIAAVDAVVTLNLTAGDIELDLNNGGGEIFDFQQQ